MSTSKAKDKVLSFYGFGSERELKLTDFLFRDCNNRCDFCFEHDKEFEAVCSGIPLYSDLTPDYISRHVDYIESLLTSYSSYDKIKLTVMGGELFMSPDTAIIRSYFEKLTDVISHCDKAISIQIVSNLMHDNIKCIKDILSAFKALSVPYILNTSFDFGPTRFMTEESYVTFKRNIDAIIECGAFNVGCGVIMTKYMLESLKADDEQAKTFRRIYENFHIDFARLSGDYKYKLTHDEMVELWKLLIDKFPNTISHSLYSDTRSIRCCLNNKHVLITGNSCVDSCVSYVYSKYANAETQCEKCKTSEILKTVTTNNCLGCPYFGYCVPVCPLDDKYDICEMREAIDYLMEKRNAVQQRST